MSTTSIHDELADGRSTAELLHIIDADEGGKVTLTRLECILIANFRDMKDTAQHMMVDLSEELAISLPSPDFALARSKAMAEIQARATGAQHP